MNYFTPLMGSITSISKKLESKSKYRSNKIQFLTGNYKTRETYCHQHNVNQSRPHRTSVQLRNLRNWLL